MIRQLSFIILLLTGSQVLFAQTEGFWVNKAVEKVKNGDFEGAIADCNKALLLNSNSVEALNNRGVAKMDLGDNESALLDFNRANVINPKSATVFRNRSFAKAHLGRYTDAIADCNQAIALGPEDSGNYFIRGYAYYGIGGTRENYNNAIADYDRYIKLGGEYKEINYRKKASAAIFNLGDKTYMDEPAWRDLDRLAELFEWKRLQTKRRTLTRRDSLEVYTENLQRYHFVATAANTSDEHEDLTYYNVRTHGPMFNYLCKKAILISKKTNPKPAIPEEARKNYMIGTSIVNDPSNYKKEDYYPSLEKLLYANIDAPWWYDVYKQLGRANELAGNYEEAIRNFQLYLLTKPPVSEARKIQDEIYIVEGKQMR